MTEGSAAPPWRSLTWLTGDYAVCRLDPGASVPDPEGSPVGLFSLTRTDSELSLVCREEDAPADGRKEMGWRVVRVGGPIPFAVTGVMAAIASALAGAGVSIFPVSTFDTDYILVRGSDAVRAERALEDAGFRFAGANE